MLNLRKTAVAVAVLASSSAVFAGTMGPVCTPGSVTVPCERTAWDFGVQALYLQTTGHDYAGSFVGTDGGTRYQDFNEDWGWGFKLEGSYHFNTGNDLNLNWYHYSKESTFTSRDLLNVIGTVGRTATTYRTEPKWDAVNLEFGQHVDFGEQKNIRFHGGAQYAHIEREFHAYQATTSNANVVTSITYLNGNTTFSGFGPRIGADMSYDFGNGFAIYGNGATELLVGSSSFNNLTPITSRNLNGSRTVIVPGLEAKLGATYTYAMAQGDFTIDAGYMWVDYLNVHNQGLVSSQTDFGLDGVYLGVKWVGNVV